MDVNEPVVEETTEKNPYGIEPESYAELEENHSKLYKNTSSGQAPKNPFIGGGGDSGFTVTFTVGIDFNDAQDYESYDATCDKPSELVNAIMNGEKINLKITSLNGETPITKYYTVLTDFAYPQEQILGVIALAQYNRTIGFNYANGGFTCFLSPYVEVPTSYMVFTTGGVARVNNEIFTGEQAYGAFSGNNMTFQMNGNDYKPLSCTYNYSQQKATIDFSIGGEIKRYTLDDSGNFAELA